MYEKIERMTTPGFRLLTALVLFIVGLIWQIASGKVLDMYAFYIMSAAMLSLASVILAKLSRAGNHFILYVLLNIVVLVAGVALTSFGGFTGVVLYSVWGI